MAQQKQSDQLEPTYSSSARIQDVALMTYQKRWAIGGSGERGSEISVLEARQDDDDGMTLPGIEPRSRGLLANTLPIRPVRIEN